MSVEGLKVNIDRMCEFLDIMAPVKSDDSTLCDLW